MPYLVELSGLGVLAAMTVLAAIGDIARATSRAESAIEAGFMDLARRRLQGGTTHDWRQGVTSIAAAQHTLLRRMAMVGG